MMFGHSKGWRRVKVTNRQPALDYAQVLKNYPTPTFPGSEKIVLVQDTLNTH